MIFCFLTRNTMNDYNYQIRELPRHDAKERSRLTQHLLPTIEKLGEMCRGEIPDKDLSPYREWAIGIANHETFYEFDYVVLFRRRGITLGFAFVRAESDDTLNVDMICAGSKGRLVMQGVYKLASLLDTYKKHRLVDKITLQAVVNSYGFYRQLGFECTNSPSLDDLWDQELKPNEGKSLPVSEEKAVKELQRFEANSRVNLSAQTSAHKFLGSFFKYKLDHDVPKLKIMHSLLTHYEGLDDIYSEIRRRIQTNSTQSESKNIEMRIYIPQGMVLWDPEVRVEHNIEDEDRISSDESSDEDSSDEVVCAPTPELYKTNPGPGFACPPEAPRLEAGKKCCTSLEPGSTDDKRSLMFLKALHAIRANADSPDNIPSELERVMGWVAKHVSGPQYESNRLVLHSRPPWLMTALKFGLMTKTALRIAIMDDTRLYYLLGRVSGDNMAVNLIHWLPDIIKDDVVRAVNEAGVFRFENHFKFGPDVELLQLSKVHCVNCQECHLQGMEKVPADLGEAIRYIERCPTISVFSLHRHCCSSDPPEFLFSAFLKRLQRPTSGLTLKFQNAVGKHRTPAGFSNVAIDSRFLVNVAQTIGIDPPVTNDSSSSTIVYQNMVVRVVTLSCGEVSIAIINQNSNVRRPRSRAVSQYDLDGQHVRDYQSVYAAATANTNAGVSATKNEDRRIRNAILTGRPAIGHRWANKGFPLKPMPIGRLQGSPVSQYTLGGEFLRNHESPSAAAATVCGTGSRKLISEQIKRSVDSGRPSNGYRWAMKDKPVKPISRGMTQAVKVSQYTPDGVYMRDHDSMLAAARAVCSMQTNKSSERGTGIAIRRAIVSGVPSNGYRWAMKDEPLKPYARKTSTPAQGGVVSQYTPDGVFVQEHKSVRLAARAVRGMETMETADHEISIAIRGAIASGRPSNGYVWAIKPSSRVRITRPVSVSQHTPDGLFVQDHRSIQAAARAVNANRGQITRAIERGGEAGGHLWSYSPNGPHPRAQQRAKRSCTDDPKRSRTDDPKRSRTMLQEDDEETETDDDPLSDDN